MKHLHLILFLALSVFSFSLYAQSSEKEIIDEFFRIFEQDPIKAFDYGFSTNEWMARNIDGTESVKNRFKDVLPLIGNYHGYETITEKAISENYKLISFLVKYDRQPLRITFVFYRAQDQWQVQNLKFDDSFGEELQESAKQNRN